MGSSKMTLYQDWVPLGCIIALDLYKITIIAKTWGDLAIGQGHLLNKGISITRFHYASIKHLRTGVDSYIHHGAKEL